MIYPRSFVPDWWVFHIALRFLDFYPRIPEPQSAASISSCIDHKAFPKKIRPSSLIHNLQYFFLTFTFGIFSRDFLELFFVINFVKTFDKKIHKWTKFPRREAANAWPCRHRRSNKSLVNQFRSKAVKRWDLQEIIKKTRKNSN